MMMLKLINPCGRCSHFVEVEHVGVEYTVEVDVAIVARHDNSLGLDGMDYLNKMVKLLGTHLRSLVQENNIAKLYLLYNKILKIVLLKVGSAKSVATCKLILHAKSIDNSSNAVETWNSFGDILRTECWY